MKKQSLQLAVAACLWTGLLYAEDYPLGPDSIKQAGVPEGEVTKYTFAGSRLYPGTTRDYWVYVPKSYDPAKPACVWVNQDGIQFNAPVVFDNLIARGEIPVLIGVFVQPGRMKAEREGALDRFNRSYEYDSLGDRYARFVLEELLPDVEKRQTSDGRPIRLSKSGNDRAISGSSSGAMAAFNAAWERPSDFGRVFSAIGTFVGLRGGNVLPTLVRKVEPKRLRVFLQDGSADNNIYGGDWWMANQEMERALTFAGYEVEHVWGEGGHNGKHAAAVFPQALRWLWKGWPAGIGAGVGSRQMQEILMPGSDWELVGEGYKFTEGPAVNEKGEVFFNDIPGNQTYRVGTGTPEVVVSDSHGANGHAFGPDGRRYVVATRDQKVLAYRPGAAEPETVAEGIRGNDLVVLNNGRVYVTEPSSDPKVQGKVWLLADGQEKREVDSGVKFPNGVVCSPDQSLLYVADWKSHWVYSYRIAADGTLENKQQFYHLHVPDSADESGADGMRVDADGRLYVATRMGIQVCDQAGRVNCILPLPNGKVSNLEFGGPDRDTLYATCGDKVYRRKVKVHGIRTCEPPIKPAAPKL